MIRGQLSVRYETANELIEHGQVVSGHVLHGRVNDGNEADDAVPRCQMRFVGVLFVHVDGRIGGEYAHNAECVEKPVQVDFGLMRQ